MNDPIYQELLDTIWRRKPTPEEEARLRAFLSDHPEKRADLEAEMALTRSLRNLPEPSLASNFASQVVRAARAEEIRRSRMDTRPSWQDWWRVLWPKTAWAGAVLLIGAAALQQHRVLVRTRLAGDLAQIPVTERLPAPEVFQDFDAIRELTHVTASPAAGQTITDEALLAALQ